MNLATATIIGRLTRDPETRTTASGTTQTTFSLAVNRKRDGKDSASFFDVKLWGKVAEIAAQYLSKGATCCVVGELAQEEWTARDGTNRRGIYIYGNTLQLGARAEAEEFDNSPAWNHATGSQRQERPVHVEQPEPEPAPIDDDLPF